MCGISELGERQGKFMLPDLPEPTCGVPHGNAGQVPGRGVNPDSASLHPPSCLVALVALPSTSLKPVLLSPASWWETVPVSSLKLHRGQGSHEG